MIDHLSQRSQYLIEEFEISQRAQRLIEEFEQGQDTRHGIAKVLTYLSDTQGVYCEDKCGSLVAVPTSKLYILSKELTAPCLLTRALAGDKDAAKQFLFEAGFTDEHGQLTGPYKSEQIDD